MKIVKEENITISIESDTICPCCKFKLQEGDEVCLASGKLFHKSCFEELKKE